MHWNFPSDNFLILIFETIQTNIIIAHYRVENIPDTQESSELSQLRPSTVEQEFRKRVKEYNSEKEFTSDSEDVRTNRIHRLEPMFVLRM